VLWDFEVEAVVEAAVEVVDVDEGEEDLVAEGEEDLVAEGVVAEEVAEDVDEDEEEDVDADVVGDGEVRGEVRAEPKSWSRSIATPVSLLPRVRMTLFAPETWLPETLFTERNVSLWRTETRRSNTVCGILSVPSWPPPSSALSNQFILAQGPSCCTSVPLLEPPCPTAPIS
jgi:hypothetical protein